ncbi:hypothetical protein [Rahnella aquatilis]|uniref:hypothetical protein n=1 Tax=Rahnella aquatilis TaxID=34038 RepID=UPI0011D21405|nr:hypothetical protein [Rahnella aquatilis]
MFQIDAEGKKSLFLQIIIPAKVIFRTTEQEYRASALPMDCHRRHYSSLFHLILTGKSAPMGLISVALKPLSSAISVANTSGRSSDSLAYRVFVRLFSFTHCGV